MDYDNITFTVPSKFKEILEDHPFFNGVTINTKNWKDTETGLVSFQLNSPSIWGAKIVGMALSDKAVPYEMLVMIKNEIVENLRVQFENGN